SVTSRYSKRTSGLPTLAHSSRPESTDSNASGAIGTSVGGARTRTGTSASDSCGTGGTNVSACPSSADSASDGDSAADVAAAALKDKGDRLAYTTGTGVASWLGNPPSPPPDDGGTGRGVPPPVPGCSTELMKSVNQNRFTPPPMDPNLGASDPC